MGQSHKISFAGMNICGFHCFNNAAHFKIAFNRIYMLYITSFIIEPTAVFESYP